MNTLTQPAAESASSCKAGSWSSLETLAYPMRSPMGTTVRKGRLTGPFRPMIDARLSVHSHTSLTTTSAHQPWSDLSSFIRSFPVSRTRQAKRLDDCVAAVRPRTLVRGSTVTVPVSCSAAATRFRRRRCAHRTRGLRVPWRGCLQPRPGAVHRSEAGHKQDGLRRSGPVANLASTWHPVRT